MIPQSLDAITEETLDALVANPIRERHSIEYKSESYGNSYKERREFLADVSSFANTVGGDLVIGIKEDGGLPVEVPGIVVANADREIRRLQETVLNALEPRLTGVEMHPVPLNNGNTVLVIRIPRSWNAPHRVILEGHDRFYARDTNGKHPMSVDELRNVFSLADRIKQRIRDFRRDRLRIVKANAVAEALTNGVTLVLHLIPLAAVSTRNVYDLEALRGQYAHLLPIGIGGNSRVNLDGVLMYSEDSPRDVHARASIAYTQLYRSGIIEAVRVFRPLKMPGQPANTSEIPPKIPSEAYERYLIQALGRYLRAQRELDIAPPVYVFLGFVNAANCRLGDGYETGILDREDIELGEIVVENLSEQPHTLLRPMFDQVWQAFGFIRSRNFDEEGNWVGH